MNTRSGILRVALYLAVFLSLVSSHRPSRVFASEPQWVEVRSPNFSVITDAGEKRGREVALRFEQMRAAFGTLMTKAKLNLPVPLQIVAFRSTKEIRQVAPIFHSKATQVAGLFQGGTDRSFIMVDMSVENPWTTVFHEYAHQLLNGNVQAISDPWFEEGFAEYFSTIEVDGKETRVGKISHDDYLIMKQVGTMKIADLFKVRQYSETYNETGNARTSFYVESGMVVHYIYDNQLLPKVVTYFDLKINQHMSVEDAIQRAFGMSATQFDKALRNYLSDGRYHYYPIPAPANISEKMFTVTPLKLADANAVLADIHLHSLDYREKAIGEFQDILKADPNNAAACRGLGYAYLQKRDFSQAADYFKRASQMNSGDPRVHYYNALLMTRQAGFSREDAPALAQELQTAISLDPNFADSYALLAFTQMSSGDPEKALETMSKALAIDPRNEQYRFNLASIYLANHQPDKAVAVLQSLQNSPNPEIVARVSSALANAHAFQDMQSGPQEAILVRRDTSGDSGASPDASPQPPPSGKNDTTKWSPGIFLRGTLSSIDCSSKPTALLTVASGPKILKLKVANTSRLVIIGADTFSCFWTNKKVAVNYRQSDAGDTSVISLELQ
ncbi:MAG TPA: tetratricopeptide repeat protein [Terriglobales bacterium]|nr:tetratricopeptide repeat protein [Terriglobales bacterium]